MTQDGDDQLARLASDDTRTVDDARRWFRAAGAVAAPVLVHGLGDTLLGGVAHWRILVLLGELALPATLPAILERFTAALMADDPIVLPGALEALAAFDAAEALSALQTALRQGGPDTVNHAAALLAARPDAAAERALVAELSSPTTDTRASVVRALLTRHTPTARAALSAHKSRERDRAVLALLKDVP